MFLSTHLIPVTFRGVKAFFVLSSCLVALAMPLQAQGTGPTRSPIGAQRPSQRPRLSGRPSSTNKLPLQAPWDAQSFERFVERCRRDRVPYKLSLKQLAEECSRAQRATGRLPSSLRYLKGFTWFFGLVVDRERQDVLLLGLKDPQRPPIDVDCLVTALAAAYTGDTPSCSLDPDPDPRLQKSVVRGVPWRSRWAEIMIEADYDMKRINQGQEDPRISGLHSWVDLMLKTRQRESSTTFKNQMNRWWFNRPNVDLPRTLLLGGTDIVLLYRNPVVVMTELKVDNKFGTGAIAREADQFAAHFSRNLALLGQKYRSIGELLALYRLLDLMVHMRLVIHGEAPPGIEYWAHGYQSPYQGPPRGMPTLKRRLRNPENGSIREYEVSGGVRMPLHVDPKSFRTVETKRLTQRVLDR